MSAQSAQFVELLHKVMPDFEHRISEVAQLTAELERVERALRADLIASFIRVVQAAGVEHGLPLDHDVDGGVMELSEDTKSPIFQEVADVIIKNIVHDRIDKLARRVTVTLIPNDKAPADDEHKAIVERLVCAGTAEELVELRVALAQCHRPAMAYYWSEVTEIDVDVEPDDDNARFRRDAGLESIS